MLKVLKIFIPVFISISVKYNIFHKYGERVYYFETETFSNGFLAFTMVSVNTLRTNFMYALFGTKKK